jgi:hypothetical protein
LTPEDKKIVLRYMHRVARPSYLGNISIELGRSLGRTEAIVLQMCDEGLLRFLNRKELTAIGAEDSAVVCALVDRHNPTLAYELLALMFCL